jgi:hypothetical protein
VLPARMRTQWRSRSWTAAFLFCAAGVPACRHKEEPSVETVAVATVDAATPVDHLAPGELLEGTEKAFGLVLPRGMHVQNALMSSVWAVGTVKMDDMANYVRVRVRGGTGTRGVVGTVFDNVTAPAEPNRILHIMVSRLPASDGCRIEVRDITPAPPLPIPTTEVERFRAAGLTPDGKFIDPQHRQ